jgi:hypothetical protein
MFEAGVVKLTFFPPADAAETINIIAAAESMILFIVFVFNDLKIFKTVLR